MATLRYIDNAGRVRWHEINAEPTTIGRAASCRVSIDDETISREHACVQPDGKGRFTLRDLGSRNRTYLNGQSVTESTLSGGDVIRVGDRVLEFVDDRAARDRIDTSFLTPDRTEPAGAEFTRIKTPLALTVSQLEMLACLASAPTLTARPEDVADAGLARLILDVQAERGFIALRGEGKRDLTVVTHRGLKRPATGSLMPVSQFFIYSAVLQNVAGRYPGSTAQLDPKSGYAAAGLVAPLTHNGDTVGVVYVDRPIAKKPFPPAALSLTAAAGAHIGALMADATRRLAHDAGREGAAWLASTKRTQALLSPKIAGSDAFAVSHHRIFGRCRCGDLCDVIHLDEHRCGLILADAGGAGVTGLAQAASVLAAVRVVVHLADEMWLDPGELMGQLNALIASRPGRHALPMTYVAMDISSGRLVYVNAGGPAPVLMVAPGRLVTLDQPSLLLGVDAEYTFIPTGVDLPETFRLVCFSDGLVEASGGAGGAFSEERLHNLLLERESFTQPEQIAARIADAMGTHLAGAKPDDDATVVVIAPG